MSSAWSMRTLALAAMFLAAFAALILAGLTVTAPAGAAGIKTFVDIEPPQPLPQVDVMTMQGEPTTLAKALPVGKPAVVNLWATWCAPCVKELPALAALQKLLGDDAAVVALSVDRGGVYAVGAFFAKTGIEGLRSLVDPRAESLQTLQARGLPTTILVDAQGREVARYEGPAEWDSADMAAQVKERLKLR